MHTELVDWLSSRGSLRELAGRPPGNRGIWIGVSCVSWFVGDIEGGLRITDGDHGVPEDNRPASLRPGQSNPTMTSPHHSVTLQDGPDHEAILWVLSNTSNPPPCPTPECPVIGPGIPHGDVDMLFLCINMHFHDMTLSRYAMPPAISALRTSRSPRLRACILSRIGDREVQTALFS